MPSIQGIRTLLSFYTYDNIKGQTLMTMNKHFYNRPLAYQANWFITYADMGNTAVKAMTAHPILFYSIFKCIKCIDFIW